MGRNYPPVPVKLLEYMEAVNRYMAGEIPELKKEWGSQGVPEQYKRKQQWQDEPENGGGGEDLGIVVQMKDFRHDRERNQLLKQAKGTVANDEKANQEVFEQIKQGVRETIKKEEKPMAKRSADSLGSINARVDALIGDVTQYQAVVSPKEVLEKAKVTPEQLEMTRKDFRTCNHHSIGYVKDDNGDVFLQLVRHVKYFQRWFSDKPVPDGTTEKGRGGKEVTMPAPPQGFTVLTADEMKDLIAG